MINYREILRLKSLGYTQRQVAVSVRSSRDTVSAVFKLAQMHDLSWPLSDELSNQMIQDLFFPERSVSKRKTPDYAAMHRDLAKSGVTLTLLWAEYCEMCYSAHEVPYQYTQFCEYYRQWAKVTKATMRIKRKPGDIMEVDWAGTSMPIYDQVTGESVPAYIFIATLPCSGYAYVEAFLSHETENWIRAHVNAYQYFGGVTRILVPDNLKTGVISNTKFEVKLNRSYAEMAEYYDTAIIPARVERPKDKPNVEGTVNHITTWICAALRNEKYFTIYELNEGISDKLKAYNSKPFKKREGSRLSAFQEEEKSYLKALPTSPYELAVWSTAIIQSDYLISDGKNKYSIPFDLIGQEVDIRLTTMTVEAFYYGSRVASHPRLAQKRREPIIQPDHMPSHHKKYLSYNEDAFLTWAANVGPNTLVVTRHFLKSGKVPEQGYKACASLNRLADRYSHQRLEDACTRALAYTSVPSIKSIDTILKTGQDKVSKVKPQPTTSTSIYGFTRGASYFGGGCND